MASLKIKKGDHVVVLAGRDKGKQGEVIAVMPKENRALVRGVNMVRRHQRQTAAAGGRHHLEGRRRSRSSNLALEDPKDGKPTRVGFKFLDDGKKVRFAKRSGEHDSGEELSHGRRKTEAAEGGKPAGRRRKAQGAAKARRKARKKAAAAKAAARRRRRVRRTTSRA